jgi:hypothetical protein
MTANYHCPLHMRRLRVGISQPYPPGACEPDPGTLRPRWPEGRNIPSGSTDMPGVLDQVLVTKVVPTFAGRDLMPRRAPCDLGHCKNWTPAKIAAPGLYHLLKQLVRGSSFTFLFESFQERSASPGTFLHLQTTMPP